MHNPICVTCGTQFPERDGPPERCPICEDERQFVGWQGQQWTTLEAMRGQYRNTIHEEEPGLFSIRTEPSFGIGQRAFLLQTPEGNVLWDCITLLDEETRERVTELGGIREIAIPHPHYYSAMVEWSRAFGDAPIHLHEADKRWVMRPDPCIRFWTGESRELLPGITLVRSGGHFEGFQVLHWAAGADGRGVLLAGDQPQVCMDRRWVSFLYSYPNYIPLGAAPVRRIVASLEPFPFDRLYGAFQGRSVDSDAGAAVARSAERYLRYLEEDASKRP
ncbi:MAG TPA: MBL fold metallo-hydrolase [Armatimonadota bacterium]|nr:MBL fold metallo-hydrolase [Armatimonadota bacterium]